MNSQKSIFRRPFNLRTDSLFSRGFPWNKLLLRKVNSLFDSIMTSNFGTIQKHAHNLYKGIPHVFANKLHACWRRITEALSLLPVGSDSLGELIQLALKMRASITLPTVFRCSYIGSIKNFEMICPSTKTHIAPKAVSAIFNVSDTIVSPNRGADRHRGPCRQTQFDCAVHGVRSSSLFRRKRRGKVLDVVSTAIPGGAAAWNVKLSGWATITEKL